MTANRETNCVLVLGVLFNLIFRFYSLSLSALGSRLDCNISGWIIPNGLYGIWFISSLSQWMCDFSFWFYFSVTKWAEPKANRAYREKKYIKKKNKELSYSRERDIWVSYLYVFSVFVSHWQIVFFFFLQIDTVVSSFILFHQS